ncbi:MAG: HAD family hydrolase [Puniceicoccales bacterium]|jgi:putative hydrolase of the HAD superfamily|nr:HAD family hydrolase [Puniceicoccales bacterium]
MPLNKTVLSLLQPIEMTVSPIKPKLKKLFGIRAVIFDVYGTLFTTKSTHSLLLESEPQSDTTIIEALEEADFDVFEHDANLNNLYVEHVKAHYDIRRAEGIAYPEINICDVWQDFLNELFVKGIIDGDLTERSIRRVIMCYECKINPVWPVKRSLEFIRNLQDNNTYAGIIATAQFYTPTIMEILYQNSLETLGFKRSICIWSYEYKHRKPSPVLFNLCQERLQTLGIDPQEVIYVGNDMLADIVPARKVGFKTAFFTGNANSTRLREDVAECVKTKPTIIFNNFDQLASCIFQ